MSPFTRAVAPKRRRSCSSSLNLRRAFHLPRDEGAPEAMLDVDVPTRVLGPISSSSAAVGRVSAALKDRVSVHVE